MTVFASGPLRADPMPPWDLAAGFTSGDDVFAARSQEDDEALAVLGATGVRLGHWESQYRDSPPRWPRLAHVARRLTGRSEPLDRELTEQVLSELERTVRAISAEVWYAPLGICHPDHRILGTLLPRLVAQNDGLDWFVYDDLPYSLERPDDRDAAHQRLASAGFELVPIKFSGNRDLKRASVACYRSQLRPLGDRAQLAVDAEEHIFQIRLKQP